MSVDYTAILCYGYKLTPEEVEKIGVEKLHEIKERYEDQPTPYGLIRSNDVWERGNEWYVGRWFEESSAEYYTEDFMNTAIRSAAHINSMMDEIFGEGYVASFEGDAFPAWHIFTRCW